MGGGCEYSSIIAGTVHSQLATEGCSFFERTGRQQIISLQTRQHHHRKNRIVKDVGNKPSEEHSNMKLASLAVSLLWVLSAAALKASAYDLGEISAEAAEARSRIAEALSAVDEAGEKEERTDEERALKKKRRRRRRKLKDGKKCKKNDQVRSEGFCLHC